MERSEERLEGCGGAVAREEEENGFGCVVDEEAE